MSDLIERMEEARKGLALAIKSDLVSSEPMIQIMLESLAAQIGMWQSEIMNLERQTNVTLAPSDTKQRCPNCRQEIDYSSYVRNVSNWLYWRCQHCGHEWHYSFHEGKR